MEREGVIGRLLLEGFEVLLADKAYGACPIVGQIFKRCFRWYVVFWVAHVGVIYPFAYGAFILLHGVGGF